VPNDSQAAVVLEDLYDAYGASCYQLAHRMVSDEPLACSIVRDVFLGVWAKETVFDPSRGSVQTWLLGVTHHRAVLELRRLRRLGRLGRLPSVGDVAVEIFVVQPKIGTVQRYVLELAYFGGYTEPEIAAFTDATPDTIKTLTVEALSQLAATRAGRQLSRVGAEN
jgi:RNA polymerase sigma-70 factor (ECF subfamily)